MTENLEALKVFYYVAKTGSVTGAAKELSVSQPAVSQALKQLESYLGVILFERRPKGVALTAEGEILLPFVTKGYEQFQLGINKLNQMKNLQVGQVHIGASDMTLQFYLLPFLEMFHEKYPDIKVKVTNAPTPETLALLEEGKIDFGVVSEPFTEKREIESIRVREIQDVFIAGSRFKQLASCPHSFRELEKLPIICLEAKTSTRQYMDQVLAECGVVLYPEFELATSDMIVRFAMKNLGVGCVVRDFAKRAIERGEVFEIPFAHQIPKRHLALVKSSESVLSTAARALLDIMKKECF